MSKEAMKLALEALGNVAVTGPDDDGIVWINLPGNGTTGKAILRVGKSGLIAVQCAKLYEEQRTKAATAIKQALAAPVQEPVAKVVLTETLGLPCLQWLDLNRQFDFKGGEYLYTVPPNVATPPAAQRTWVGLTDDEKRGVCRVGPVYAPDGVVTRTPLEYRKELEGVALMAVRQAEAKLKEKNT